jgi:hypothetical protein
MRGERILHRRSMGQEEVGYVRHVPFRSRWNSVVGVHVAEVFGRVCET